MFDLLRSVHFGDYELSCGERTKYLVDTAQILRTKEAQDFVRTNCKIPSEWSYDKLGGPLSAADLLCPLLGADEWFGVRNAPKCRGTDIGKITGNFNRGDHVVLVEDVVTSGATLIKAIREVIDHGGIVTGLYVFIERKDFNGRENIRKEFDWIPFFSRYRFMESMGGVTIV